MGLFDLFREPMEMRLERIYIPSYRMMGMSDREAREMFREWLVDAKEQVALGNRFVAADKFGSDLLGREFSDPNAGGYLKKIRSEGVTNKDIIWFWDMPSLERVMMMRNFEWHVGAKFQAEVRQGRTDDQAWIVTRRVHPYYGDIDDATGPIGEDKPIPFELKDRVDIYILHRQKSDFDKFVNEMRESSSFNALARKAIRAGRL
jgi:hypothetical protein